MAVYVPRTPMKEKTYDVWRAIGRICLPLAVVAFIVVAVDPKGVLGALMVWVGMAAVVILLLALTVVQMNYPVSEEEYDWMKDAKRR